MKFYREVAPHLASHVADHFVSVAALGLDHSHDGLDPRHLCPLLAFASHDVMEAITPWAHLKIGQIRCACSLLAPDIRYNQGLWNLMYRAGRPIIRKVLKIRIWVVPPVCLGSS